MIFESDLYKQWEIAAPFVLSIFIVTIIIFASTLYYKIAMSKTSPDQVPGGFALVLFITVNFFRNMVRDLLGEAFEKFTPLFLAIFLYILCSNMIGLLSLDPPTASITVTLSLGLITWVGTQVIGIRYQKINYLKSFFFNITVKGKDGHEKKIPVLPNPIEILGKFTPLISISFRLWGNIFAGVLITTLIYSIPFIFIEGIDVFGDLISGATVRSSPIMILGSILAPPLHLYLDVMTGAIQAYVFLILTMVYWSMAMEEE